MSNERRKQELLIKIDKIKGQKRAAVVFALTGIPLGIFMLYQYLAYPLIRAYTWTLLIFGILFILQGIVGIYSYYIQLPEKIEELERKYTSL